MTPDMQDPTRAGPPVPDVPGRFARFSLAEIEALAAKAARGAGMPWGVAEEAGAAARWLAEQDMPGPEMLLAHLVSYDGRPWADVAPAVSDGVWRHPAGRWLCPIATGTALADWAALPGGPGSQPITIERVASPILLLPFAALGSDSARLPLRVRWQGMVVIVARRSLTVAAGPDDLLIERAGAVTVEAAADVQARPRVLATGRVIALDVWRSLDALALRTTVPASEPSRAGAGAGTLDND